MIPIGIIGYGNMGSMLVNTFISEKIFKEEEIIVSTRTKEKLKLLKEKYSNINIAEDNKEVVKKAKYIFICVKQIEVRGVLEEIRDFLNERSHIISLAGAVSLENIEKIFDGKITKITPTILSEVKEGITLLCHNKKVEEEDKAFIEGIFSKISRVKRISEKDFALAVELTSCAPGFFASIFEEFVNSSIKHNTSLSLDDIKEMIIYTILGTVKLFIEKDYSFDEVINKVATKGGITEEGVKVIKEKIPSVFDEVFEKTLEKRKIIKEKVEEEFRKV